MNQKVLGQLANLVNIPVNELTKAIEDESLEKVDVKISKTFTDDEWIEYESNVSKERDKEYLKGKEVGINQHVRDAKEELGLTFEGKDFNIFIDKLKEKAIQDAGIEVDTQVQVVKKDLDAFRNTYSTDISKIEKERDEAKNKYESLLTNQEISKFIPETLSGVTKRDAMTILKSEYEFVKDEDGNSVVKKGGEVLKNKTQKPLSWESVINDSLIERSWLSNTDGRGDREKNIKTSQFSNMSELNDYFDANGINSKSKEARVMINEAANNNKDFEF